MDAFLERITRDPQGFAHGLRKIGRKYGAVLLPKEHVAAIKIKAVELQNLMIELNL